MKVRLDDLLAKDNGRRFEGRKHYEKRLAELQLELLHFQRLLREAKRCVILVFEGPDAAGKGGIIRRLGEKLDHRTLRVYSVVKPTPEELAHHYLWRFWTKFPPFGDIAIFDRSWYGRVLVERVEGFASDTEWGRAYDEINNLERTLVDNGALLLKFYIHISKDEQLKRFRAREADPYKHWKINDEDWRNRRKWDQHNEAAEDMLRHTDTRHAPWHVFATDSKWVARVSVLKTVVKSLRDIFGS